MEEGKPETLTQEQAESKKVWYTPFTRITTFSKYLVLVILAVLSFVGVWTGVEWGKELTDTVSDKFICGESSVTDHDGNIYETVLVGTQCWMASNMVTGVLLTDSAPPSDNGVIEKYCYEDNPNICEIEGGLYTWHEAMQYSNNPQGICPPGWHIPSDEEWHLLELFLTDSVENCDPHRTFVHHANNPHMGCDGAGKALRDGGISMLNIPLAGTIIFIGESWFGIPGFNNISYRNRGYSTGLWSSTYALGTRTLFADDDRVGRENISGGFSSVRCVKDIVQ